MSQMNIPNISIPGLKAEGEKPRPTMDSMSQAHAKAVKAAERRVREIEEEIGDIEFDISELRAREADLEDEYEDAQAELEEVKAGNFYQGKALGGGVRISCRDCGVDFGVGSDSAHFRADQHAADTGHRVVAVLPGGSALIPGDCLELEPEA